MTGLVLSMLAGLAAAFAAAAAFKAATRGDVMFAWMMGIVAFGFWLAAVQWWANLFLRIQGA